MGRVLEVHTRLSFTHKITSNSLAPSLCHPPRAGRAGWRGKGGGKEEESCRLFDLVTLCSFI